MLNYQTGPLDRAYQALGDATRRALVERLARGPATVSQLAAPLPMSLPAVMLHLKVLEESGLVTSEKNGRVRTCQLDPEMLSKAEHWIADVTGRCGAGLLDGVVTGRRSGLVA